MPRKTVVCRECGKPVPSGRLACPSCGSLVAAVTGPSRRTTRGATTTALDDSTATARRGGNGSFSGSSDQSTNGTDTRASSLAIDAAPNHETGPDHESSRTAAQLLGASTSLAPSRQRSAALGPATPSVLEDWPPKPPRTLDDPTGRDLDGVHRTEWDTPSIARPSAVPVVATQVSGAYVPPSTAAPAGSPYLAPSSVFNAAAGATQAPVATGPSIDQAGSAPHNATGGQAAAREKPIRPGSASLFADLPFDAPNTLIGWLVALGSGAATIGFFLPWSSIVIGAASTGGSFTETWGLANPTHLLVLIASFVGFLLSVLPNRVPVWLRSSLLGLVLGGVLIGLAWPYLFAAGFGYRVGVIVEIFGALVLIVAGVLSILPSRHESESNSV
jgi:hypothetical protein